MRRRVSIICCQHAKTYVRNASMRSRIARPQTRSAFYGDLSFPLSRRDGGTLKDSLRSQGEDPCARARSASVRDRYQATDTWDEDTREVKVDTRSRIVDPRSEHLFPASCITSPRLSSLRSEGTCF